MTEDGSATGDDKGPRQRMEDGIRSGIGILSALKEALEETIHEARDRGDLSAERAKELVKDAVSRAQEAASGARERLDFASRSELEELQEAVEALRGRVADLERSVSGQASGGAGKEGGEGA